MRTPVIDFASKLIYGMIHGGMHPHLVLSLHTGIHIGEIWVCPFQSFILFLPQISHNCVNIKPTSKLKELKSKVKEYGVTEAESIQILNLMPTEPVEIHLMVEDLHSRMSETKQEEFLNMIQSYNSTTNSGSDDDTTQQNTCDVVEYSCRGDRPRFFEGALSILLSLCYYRWDAFWQNLSATT